MFAHELESAHGLSFQLAYPDLSMSQAVMYTVDVAIFSLVVKTSSAKNNISSLDSQHQLFQDQEQMKHKTNTHRLTKRINIPILLE